MSDFSVAKGSSTIARKLSRILAALRQYDDHIDHVKYSRTTNSTLERDFDRKCILEHSSVYVDDAVSKLRPIVHLCVAIVLLNAGVASKDVRQISRSVH